MPEDKADTRAMAETAYELSRLLLWQLVERGILSSEPLARELEMATDDRTPGALRYLYFLAASARLIEFERRLRLGETDT